MTTLIPIKHALDVIKKDPNTGGGIYILNKVIRYIASRESVSTYTKGASSLSRLKT